MALVVGAVLIAFSDDDVREAAQYFFQRPADTLVAIWHRGHRRPTARCSAARSSICGDTVAGVFGPLANTLLFATPLIAGGLAVAIPFKAGMFNIGAEGQITIAASSPPTSGSRCSCPPVVHVIARSWPRASSAARCGGSSRACSRRRPARTR
jgi:general nucleoside transport system permease protein